MTGPHTTAALLACLTAAMLACLALIAIAPHAPGRVLRGCLGTAAALIVTGAYVLVLLAP